MGDNEKGTVMQPLQGPEAGGAVPEGQKSKQYIVALAACLGAFAAGTVLAWTSPAGQILKSNATEMNNPLPEPITGDQDGWIGSLMAIGALIGAFPTGILCDKIGRRWTILSLGVPFIISWTMIAFAGNVVTLYIARIFAGMATGGSCVAIPMYVAEIAEGSIRGTLGSFFQLLLTVGILFMYLLAYVNYTVLALLPGAAVIAFVVVFFFMPETPAYLLKKGNRAEAEAVLKKLRGEFYDTKPEISRLQEEIDESERNKASISDLCASRANLNALAIGLLLMIFQQLSGINAVIFYTAGIFESAGSTLSAAVCAIVVGVVQVIATYIATVLVDRAGRKLLLLISSAVMCICLLVLGVYFHIQSSDPDTAKNLGWLPLLCVTLFIITFSLGFGPLPWLMLGELFAPSIKSVAVSLAVCLNWTMTFIVTKTFGILLESIGTAATFWMFSSITALGFIFVLLRVPETKGKTVQEIQRMLGGR